MAAPEVEPLCGGAPSAGLAATSEDAGLAAGDDQAVPTFTQDDQANASGNFHLSCRDFTRVSNEKVLRWLTGLTKVPLTKVFKLPQWNFAFVTVAAEYAAAFQEAVNGTKYRNNVVTVKAGHPRDANNRKAGNSQGAQRVEGDDCGAEDDGDREPKRRKVTKDFAPGYVPTLKDLKDRLKQRKGAGGGEVSVVQKSAPLLEWSYDTQLNMKATYVKSSVRSFTKQVLKRCLDEDREPPAWTSFDWSLACSAPIGCGCPLDAPIGTPEEHLAGYRNKCEFTVGRGTQGGSAGKQTSSTAKASGAKTGAGESGEVGSAATGFCQKQAEVGFVLKVIGNGDQLVACCDEVPLVPPQMKRLCSVLRDCVRSSRFSVFDRRTHVKIGVWRLFMARLSPAGEMLLLVQTTTLEEQDQQEISKLITDALESAKIGVVSIYLQFNDEVTDAARPDAKLIHIYGKPRLTMHLLGLNFEIGPLSFFQANTVTCAALYEKALEWLQPAGAVVLDICCGVGTIGLCTAARCLKVIGIELVPEAVQSAERNSIVNGITNAHFRVGKAEDVLPQVLSELGPDCEVCAVVDPPRPGIHRDVATALRNCTRLSRIVYISCNPESLADDVVRLTVPQEDEDCFVPVRAVAVDMFPHTLHCEMILLLERATKVKDPRTAPRNVCAETVAAKDVDEAVVSLGLEPCQ